MAQNPGFVDLSSMRPKSFLKLRLMLDGAWKILTLIGVCFALGAVVALIVLALAIRQERTYQREGLTAGGTVTSKTTETDTERDIHTGAEHTTTAYVLGYSFQVDGNTLEGRGTVPEAKWQAASVGGPVAIQYLPSDPARNRPVQDNAVLVWLLLFLPGGLLVTAAVMLLISGRRACRMARLLGQGKLVQGMVDSKEERTNIEINGKHPFTVRYSFQADDGRGHTGEDLVTDLAFANALTAGEAVGVIFMPGDADSSALFRDKWQRYYRAG